MSPQRDCDRPSQVVGPATPTPVLRSMTTRVSDQLRDNDRVPQRTRTHRHALEQARHGPRAISSAGERFPDTEEVTGSIPVSRTGSRVRHASARSGPHAAASTRLARASVCALSAREGASGAGQPRVAGRRDGGAARDAVPQSFSSLVSSPSRVRPPVWPTSPEAALGRRTGRICPECS
jgi:hypothetical protein